MGSSECTSQQTWATVSSSKTDEMDDVLLSSHSPKNHHTRGDKEEGEAALETKGNKNKKKISSTNEAERRPIVERRKSKKEKEKKKKKKEVEKEKGEEKKTKTEKKNDRMKRIKPCLKRTSSLPSSLPFFDECAFIVINHDQFAKDDDVSLITMPNSLERRRSGGKGRKKNNNNNNNNSDNDVDDNKNKDKKTKKEKKYTLNSKKHSGERNNINDDHENKDHTHNDKSIRPDRSARYRTLGKEYSSSRRRSNSLRRGGRRRRRKTISGKDELGEFFSGSNENGTDDCPPEVLSDDERSVKLDGNSPKTQAKMARRNSNIV